MKRTKTKMMPDIGSREAQVIAVALSGNLRAEAFIDALGRGGSVALDGDISVDGEISVPSGADIDLRGHTIRSSAATAALRFTGGASTITGGTVTCENASEATTAIRVDSGASLTIRGGTYHVGAGPSADDGNACVYTTGGAITIEGGTFSSADTYKGKYYVLNVKDGTEGTITVNGGRFKRFDPSAPGTGDAGLKLGDGAKSVAEYYEVTKQ